MEDKPTKDEMEFAEEAWEIMQDMVRDGDPYGIYMQNALNRYSGNKRKQIRVLGLLNEIYGKSPIPNEEMKILVRKWGIEDLLPRELGFSTISLD